ncbi:hypothetical protein [Brevibacillus nitrificans]|uniref:hypothetical protein n=1 Tax=Brevibacillus nitrificans TaxID=651560 RepID=UPI00285CF1EA|nr:hypothetical protein [Brevibacillus nitrificans]MDR7314695.1 hypothetical protein [Brevibacillus nitrificans]
MASGQDRSEVHIGHGKGEWLVVFLSNPMKKEVVQLLGFLLTVGIAFLLVFVLFKKFGVTRPFSRLALLSLIFCVLATACLGVNYVQSLLPGLQDGIAVSNALASFIIGEDQWSHEKFLQYFEGFMATSVLLMVFYIIALIGESRTRGK